MILDYNHNIYINITNTIYYSKIFVLQEPSFTLTQLTHFKDCKVKFKRTSKINF